MTGSGDGRPSPVARPEVAEAVIHSGSAEIPYRRAGRGRPVVLLVDPSDPVRTGVMERLVETRLVIQPVVLPTAGTWSTWLAAIVEGLGLEVPDVVVDRGVRGEVLAFAESHPGWLGRIDDVGSIDP